MKRSLAGWCLIAIGFFTIAVTPLAAQSSATDDIIRGIVARSEAFLSGEIIYDEEHAIRGIQSKNGVMKLVFYGSSWHISRSIRLSDAKMDPNAKGKVEIPESYLKREFEGDWVSHKGLHVEFSRMPQVDDTVKKLARITLEKRKDEVSLPPPPVFAGTFWYDCQRQFVRSNAARAILKPSVETSAGRAEVLEWPVSAAEKYKAFHGINEVLESGGTLRVACLPSLGYCLARVECIGSDGKLGALYENVDFFEAAKLFFLPRKLSKSYYDAQGLMMSQSYTILDAKDINQAIPDERFVIPLPLGTQIHDARHGPKAFTFKLKDAADIPDDMREILTIEKPSFFQRDARTAILLGFGLGVMALMGGVILARRRRALRRSPS